LVSSFRIGSQTNPLGSLATPARPASDACAG